MELTGGDSHSDYLRLPSRPCLKQGIIHLVLWSFHRAPNITGPEQPKTKLSF